MQIRIADAAASLDTQAHVLRHWEDVGVIVPKRLASGHRVYDDDLIDRARIVQLLQRAGLSLVQIRTLSDLPRDERLDLVTSHRAGLRSRIAELTKMEAFLAHTEECTHPIIAECPECSAFARGRPNPLPSSVVPGEPGGARHGGNNRP